MKLNMLTTLYNICHNMKKKTRG